MDRWTALTRHVNLLYNVKYSNHDTVVLLAQHRRTLQVTFSYRYIDSPARASIWMLPQNHYSKTGKTITDPVRTHQMQYNVQWGESTVVIKG